MVLDPYTMYPAATCEYPGWRHSSSVDAASVQISVAEVFGNCPMYIQARTLEAESVAAAMSSVRRGSVLTASQQRAIERADTLFIGSVHEGTGADASHRGGRPGFVRVVDERRLRLPDYAGNNMFQTLGNISKDPRVGLLFVDFASGTTRQLTGRARILWDSASFADLPGAELAVDIEVDLVVELEGRVAGGSRLVAPSPFNPSRAPISSRIASGSAPHRHGSPTLPSPRDTTSSE